MKILVDENIPRMTVDHLREVGHDVKDVRDTSCQGLLDPDLWSLAMREGRMLITTDKGFTEHRGGSHFGILIVRLRQLNRHKIHQAVVRVLGRFSAREWPGLLAVVRDRTVSISRTHR